jgi:hypothetical protein
MITTPIQMVGFTEFIWGVLACFYCAILGYAFMKGLQFFAYSRHVNRSQFDTSTNPAVVFFLSTTTGIAVVCKILFVLGISKALNPWMIAFALSAALLIAITVLWRCGTRFSINKSPAALSESLLTIVTFLLVGLTLTWLCIKPPGMWDDTSYHLPYARHYLEEHQLSINPWLRFPLFPHNGNLLFTLTLAWGSEVRAQVMATAIPLTLIAIGLYGACQEFLKSRLAGWLSVGLLWNLSPVRETLGYAYIDNLLMMFCWAAMLAMAMALRQQKFQLNAWLLICGLLAGTAAGTKLFGAVITILIGACFMLSWGWRNKAVWIYAATASVFGLEWYVRSFLISGDPVHPLGGNIFGHYLWSAADLASQHQEQATHGTSKNPMLIVTSLQKAGIGLILPGLLALLQPRLWDTPTRALALIVFFFIAAWQTTSQVARYTAPILPAAAFLSIAWLYYAGSAFIQKRLLKNFQYLHWFPVLLYFAIVAAWSYSKRDTVSTQIKSWHDNLENRSGFNVMQEANSRSSQLGRVLVHLGYENAVYFFQGKVIGDWFGPGRYSQMLDCTKSCQVESPENLRKLLVKFESNMLAINGARFKFTPSEYAVTFDITETSKNNYLLTLRDPITKAP